MSPSPNWFGAILGSVIALFSVTLVQYLFWYGVTKANCCCLPCCVGFLGGIQLLGSAFTVVNVFLLVAGFAVFQKVAAVVAVLELGSAIIAIPTGWAMIKIYQQRKSEGTSDETKKLVDP